MPAVASTAYIKENSLVFIADHSFNTLELIHTTQTAISGSDRNYLQSRKSA